MPSRRSFLAASAAVSLSPSVFIASTAAAADEAVSERGPLMKLSLAGYSFNRWMVRRGTPEQIANSRMTLESFIDFCADQQLGATELTGYYFPKQITDDYLLGLRGRTHRLGLSISGTAIGNNFCAADSESRAAQIEECKQWVDYSATMGAPVIRIFAGSVPKGETEEASVRRCLTAMEECLDYAAQRGIFLALENHGGITATPDQMMKLITPFADHPWFGVNFDSGNFRTDNPYRDLERIAPYAVNAQVKVAVAPNGNKQPADLERIVGILRAANYRGYVALEYEEKTDPLTEIPRYLQLLRELIRG